jgi:hypothetical protein
MAGHFGWHAVTDIASGRMGSAERMRRHRFLRKVGLRSIPVQLHEHEIEGLISSGLLRARERQDPTAVAIALGQYLDRHPIRAK